MKGALQPSDGKAPTLLAARAEAAGGAVWGGLIGLIFLAPLLGMAVGAAAGAAGGAMADYGVDDRFMKELGENSPGSAALIVLVRSMTPDKILTEISRSGAEVGASAVNGAVLPHFRQRGRGIGLL